MASGISSETPAVAQVRGGKGASRPPRTTRRAGSRLTGLWFVIPALGFFAVFTLYPVIQMVYLAMTRSSGYGGSQFVGLQNFVTMSGDPVFWQAAGNTFVYTIATAVLLTVVPLFLALLIHNGPKRAGVVYRTLIFVPAAISLTVTGLLWRIALNPNGGYVNRIIEAIGLGDFIRPWLADPLTVMPVIILVTLWQSCGLYMLILLAGLGNIDPSVEESALIDGAGPIRQAWSVTIPMMWPVIAVVVMLNVIHGLKVFDLNYVMARGGPFHASESLSTYMFTLTFGTSAGTTSAFGYGSAIGLVVFAITAVATIIQFRLRKARL